MENQKNQWSRRRFLATAAAGAAGIAVIPRLTGCGRVPDDGIIRLGFIGLGRQAMSLLNGFIRIQGVEVVAGCDVYGIKRKRFEKRVSDFYTKEGKTVEVETCEKYQDLLKRKDITAVVIAVPDHSHAMIAIAACKAGKDVYLEKPMTFTIKEGQELKKAVRENGRVLAVGSQQRSDANFQHAVSVVQSGALGHITLVNAYVGDPPKPYDLPEETIPADLNWDLWLGPLAVPIHYNSQLNPPITLDPEQNEKIWGAWRWYKEMGG
ncbi:MAG: Gfo/Idh/MocA family oxidoreductase, partial [Bacteroidales bacterium]|nr:Gfo/Idh/MocA family oxidoreductase [Bacteroidales bacterium]